MSKISKSQKEKPTKVKLTLDSFSKKEIQLFVDILEDAQDEFENEVESSYIAEAINAVDGDQINLNKEIGEEEYTKERAEFVFNNLDKLKKKFKVKPSMENITPMYIFLNALAEHLKNDESLGISSETSKKEIRESMIKFMYHDEKCMDCDKPKLKNSPYCKKCKEEWNALHN
jgi:superfamily I DNA/RNA helicase